jgi:hypothetical protein
MNEQGWVPFETIICENGRHTAKYLYIGDGSWRPLGVVENLLIDIREWASRTPRTLSILFMHGDIPYMTRNFHVWNPDSCPPLIS